MYINHILSNLNIPYLYSNVKMGEDYIDIDFYDLEQELIEGVIYISQYLIEKPIKNTIIYTDSVEDIHNEYVILGDIEVSSCYTILHRFLMKNNYYMYKIMGLTDGIGDMNSPNRLKEIVHYGAHLLNNPIILTNSSYKVLAIEDLGEAINDPVFDTAKRYGYCTSESVRLFEMENITKKVLQSSEAFLLNHGMAKEIPRILSKICVNNQVVAYIGVLQWSKMFDTEDLIKVDQLCRMIRNELEKDQSLTNGINIIYEALIVELINEEITQPAVLKKRLESCYWDLKEQLRCSVITFDKKTHSFSNMPYLINRFIRRLGLKALALDNRILIIHNYNTHEEWHRQLSFVKQEAEKHEMKVGVSNEFHSLLELKTHYEEASTAIEIANVLEAEDTVFYFTALLPYYFISKMDKETLKSCRNTYYNRLFQYDQKHGTDYIKSLYYYVLYNCDISRTAKKLYIHRNTMAHRLEKIHQIANVPLDNGMILQNFVLYVQMKKYLTKIEKQSQENK